MEALISKLNCNLVVSDFVEEGKLDKKNPEQGENQQLTRINPGRHRGGRRALIHSANHAT